MIKKKHNIVVWGGSGFLGSHVSDFLSKEGHKVTIADIKESPYKQKNQKFVHADITDSKQVDKIIKNNDYVYNFAGIANIDESNLSIQKTIDINIKGNFNILNSSIKYSVRRYIFASTVYVYSDSGGFYKCSKQACEQYIQEFNKQYKLKFNILRFGTLYGPRADDNNSIKYFIKQILNNKRINYYGKSDSKREYVHVFDAAKISCMLLNEKYKNQHFIIAGNQSTKVKDTIKMISDILKRKKVKVNYEKGNKNK